jgi:hypothetical protein
LIEAEFSIAKCDVVNGRHKPADPSGLQASMEPFPSQPGQ